jgi:hypothetical protein
VPRPLASIAPWTSASPSHAGWGEEHADLFAARFEIQRRQEGFALVEARDGADLAGFAFGVTLQPTTPWWNNLTSPLPAEVTTERPGRTFALVEMLVRAPWRRRHVAQGMHDLLLDDRPEERATLTVLPAAAPAQACGCRISCHPMRPGHIRGSGHQAGPVAGHGHSGP